MADRIVLNTISYHGHGAIENSVPELTARGYKKAFVCSDPDLIKFGVTGKITIDPTTHMPTGMSMYMYTYDNQTPVMLEQFAG